MIATKNSHLHQPSFGPRHLVLSAMVMMFAITLQVTAVEDPPPQPKPFNPVQEEQQPPPEELLEQAINRMQSARKRIASGEAGKETQQLQQQAIDDLAQLIKRLKNQPQQQQQQPPQNPPPQKPQDRKPQQPKPSPQNQQQQQQQPGGQPSYGKSSSEQEKRLQQSKENAAARAQMLRDIWGHLPEAIRNQLGNSFSEDYLPKYAAEVRKYYEELAKRSRSRRP